VSRSCCRTQVCSVWAEHPFCGEIDVEHPHIAAKRDEVTPDKYFSMWRRQY
jgi:hypothetical protein